MAPQSRPHQIDEAVSFDHYCGYHFSDNHIRSFSHTHVVGAGVGDWGNIGVMPVLGVTKATITNNGYWSNYSHNNEIATPGYYSVLLHTPSSHFYLI